MGESRIETTVNVLVGPSYSPRRVVSTHITRRAFIKNTTITIRCRTHETRCRLEMKIYTSSSDYYYTFSR